MRIIFFGSDPWFSPPVLEAILKAKHQVALIVTKGEAFKNSDFPAKQDPAPRDRFQNSELIFMEAKTVEDILRFTIYDLRFTNDNRPDAIILAAFGPPFLPTEVLNWPKYGCLNVHASLLPRWRGASPVFGALANGDKETGVTIMRMTEEIDRGPILGQAKTIITDYDTRETLTRRLGLLGGGLIVETLRKLSNDQIIEVKQPPKSPTSYTHRLTKDSGRINWTLRPGETSPERSRRIERFIRAVTPWPGAQTRAKFRIQNSEFRIDELKILKAHLEFSHSPIPTPKLTTNNQQLLIDLVQLPGKNPVSWGQFLAGHPEVELK